jgi:hypothetical protein
MGVGVNRYPAALRAALAPLPFPMPSMLRQQRLCRIQLAALTRDIARRLRTESQPAQEST